MRRSIDWNRSIRKSGRTSEPLVLGRAKREIARHYADIARGEIIGDQAGFLKLLFRLVSPFLRSRRRTRSNSPLVGDRPSWPLP